MSMGALILGSGKEYLAWALYRYSVPTQSCDLWEIESPNEQSFQLLGVLFCFCYKDDQRSAKSFFRYLLCFNVFSTGFSRHLTEKNTYVKFTGP